MRHERRGRMQRAGSRKPATGGSPQRQVAAGGMTHQNRAREVQAMDRRRFAQPVDRDTDVLEGAGIAAPRLVGAAVPKAPDRYSAPRQVRPEVTELLAARGGRAPAAAVQEDGDGMWARARRQEDVDGLGG